MSSWSSSRPRAGPSAASALSSRARPLEVCTQMAQKFLFQAYAEGTNLCETLLDSRTCVCFLRSIRLRALAATSPTLSSHPATISPTQSRPFSRTVRARRLASLPVACRRRASRRTLPWPTSTGPITRYAHGAIMCSRSYQCNVCFTPLGRRVPRHVLSVSPFWIMVLHGLTPFLAACTKTAGGDRSASGCPQARAACGGEQNAVCSHTLLQA